jgi:hypothetical protein
MINPTKRNMDDCQLLYKRLLYTLDGPLTEDSAKFYIKRMKETSECDHVADFSEIRKELLYVGLHKYGSIETDKKVNDMMRYNIYHYNIPHRRSLRNALSPYNRMNYEYSVFKAELLRIYRNIFE